MASAENLTVNIDREGRTKSTFVITVRATRARLLRFRLRVFGAGVWLAAKLSGLKLYRVECELLDAEYHLSRAA